MTEQEYIDATNLTKLRTAATIVADLNPTGDIITHDAKTFMCRALHGFIMKLEDKVVCEEPDAG